MEKYGTKVQDHRSARHSGREERADIGLDMS